MNGKKLENIGYRTTAEPKTATPDGIPVFCAHDEIIPVETLKPNPQNPNHHPEDQIRLLADIIKQTGWRQPITISNQSGYITKGHGRLLAAQYEEWEYVPVDFQNYSSRDEEYADLIADNRLAELSEIEDKAMAEMLQSFDNPDMLALTGYDNEDFDKLLDSLIDDAMDENQEEQEEIKKKPETLLTRAGDTWDLGENRLLVVEANPAVDAAVNEYVYETDDLSCKCIRDGQEYGYMEIVSAWAEENGITEDIFKLRKSKLRRK